MWRKWILPVAVSLLLAAPGASRGQLLNPSTNTLDPITQRALDELDRLTLTGTPEQVKEQLLRVINSSGYIKPLARVFYQLAAQNEGDANQAAQSYFTVIDQWPESAWAQKALIELAPLILMSDGEVGAAYIQPIWKKQDVLLSKAVDAAEVGETPETLLKEVFLNLVYIANQQNLSGLLESLSQHPLAQHPDAAEVVALARASASIHSGRPELGEARLQAWLSDWPHSPLRAYAYLLFYESSGDPSARHESAARIRDEYAETLEARMLERRLTNSGRF